MKKYDTVCVLVYKTNATLLILVAAYKLCVTNHLLKAAYLYLHPKLINLFEEVNKLIQNANIDLSSQK